MAEVVSRSDLLSLPLFQPGQSPIQMEDKACPIADREDNETIQEDSLAFVMGPVNHMPLKRFVLNNMHMFKGKNQHDNVRLVRPAHDRWGVGKIMFKFCDDFMLRMFEFPWWHKRAWSNVLEPLFEELGIPPHRIVRCLLAQLPPNVNIPVHHDTGLWVTKTHRVHIPVVTNENVIFRVGRNPDQMQRMEFAEGFAIELNNQSKHAVINLGDSDRIHLIFDYVDSDDLLPPCFTLEPGTSVFQTRRSLDLESEAGSRPAPSFLIIGAQKSGTTSMYEWIHQHDLVLRGKRRETHFFDWRWRDDLETKDEKVQEYMNYFQHATLYMHPSLMAGESSPSYLLNSHIVIERIKEVCEDSLKLIVMLRNPVHRAFSQYQMCKDPNGTAAQKKARGSLCTDNSFIEVMRQEMEELAACCGLTASDVPSYDSFRDNYLTSRPLSHGGNSFLGRGLYAMQLIPWLEAFPRESIKILCLEEVTQHPNEAMEEVFEFLGLPPQPLFLEAHNTRSYDAMEPEVRAELSEFYRTHNEVLFDMIGRRFDW